MTCLVITLIAFFKVSEIRTQPGQNNMALTINLLLAQLMLLVGVDQLDYLSIILNSLQGIFLFWSFILNKSVLNKLMLS
ncbi:uncharacterized protein LOC126832703 [Patella vulgata]|uniref:uncharacterized protein LOC126832703 n=1 Tax=Patella vulgata TaxID=6465 RepID=UPI0024A9529D|nr:uncharacterized protein LOC126832703 [Patella vulgata]